MTDLTERLRADLPQIDGYNGPYVDEDYVHDLLGEAADELDRLRAEVERQAKIIAEFEHSAAQAYGLLWRYLGTDKLPHRARGILLPLIGQKGQEAGIAFVNEQYGPVTDDEILMAAEEGVKARAALQETEE